MGNLSFLTSIVAVWFSMGLEATNLSANHTAAFASRAQAKSNKRIIVGFYDVTRLEGFIPRYMIKFHFGDALAHKF